MGVRRIAEDFPEEMPSQGVSLAQRGGSVLGAGEQYDQRPRGEHEVSGLKKIRMAGSWGGMQCQHNLRMRVSEFANVVIPVYPSLCHDASGVHVLGYICWIAALLEFSGWQHNWLSWGEAILD